MARERGARRCRLNRARRRPRARRRARLRAVADRDEATLPGGGGPSLTRRSSEPVFQQVHAARRRAAGALSAGRPARRALGMRRRDGTARPAGRHLSVGRAPATTAHHRRACRVRARRNGERERALGQARLAEADRGVTAHAMQHARGERDAPSRGRRGGPAHARLAVRSSAPHVSPNACSACRRASSTRRQR
jgi:hypothetical protein